MNGIYEKILQYLKKYDANSNTVKKLSEEDDEDKKTEKVKLASVTSEVSETDNSNSNKNKALKENLLALDDKLKGVNNQSILQKMEYTPLTDEEIKEKASSGVEEKYALKLEDETTKKDQKIKELESQVDAIKQSANEEKENVDKLYKSAEEALENSAIKRGISRSSIVQEQIKDLNVEKISDLLSIDEKVASTLKSNSERIKQLEEEYLSAVNRLNIEKALEINEKIEKLTDEQNEKIEEVLKYNNTVTRQELELDKDKVLTLTENEKRAINQEKLRQALNYYYTMPKEQAYKEFQNDEEMQALLGDVAKMVEKYLKVI